MSLYEGTNGIQAMDLMGRKMRINQGAPFQAFVAEIETFYRENLEDPFLGKTIREFAGVFQKLKEVAETLSQMSAADPMQWASQTYPALLCFGEVIVAWRLLDLALIARKQLEADPGNSYYTGKVLQATYWTETNLPITLGRLETCLRTGREVVEIPEEAF
jgi:hypothetical protein